MRLVSQYNGHKPARILESDQSACAGTVTCEIFHQIEEFGVMESYSKGLPFRTVYMIIERRRIAKTWFLGSDVFP
ncbi:hypothetical protein D3C76_1446490 [compost metagenome]